MGRTTLRVSLPSYFFTLWTVSQTQILQIVILPNLFLECQIANNNFDYGRRWTSYTYRYCTEIQWRSSTSVDLKFILGTRRDLLNSAIFFIYWICSISLLVTTTWRFLTLNMDETSADMESSCEYIKCTVPDIREMIVVQYFVWRIC